MKLHLNLSLRRALLAAMAAVASLATTSHAGLVDERYDLQYYLDFSYNKGQFTAGATGIETYYKDGAHVQNPVITIIPNLDSYAQKGAMISSGFSGNGGAGLVAPQYVMSAVHCAETEIYFLTENENYSTRYTSTGFTGASSWNIDWSVQRLNKIVTEVAYTPYADDNFMSQLSRGDVLYRIGNGMYVNSAGQRLDTDNNALGGLINISSIGKLDTNTWQIISHIRKDDTETDVRPPLEIGALSGDSGSPVYAWDDENNRFVQVAFASASNVAQKYGNDLYARYNANDTTAFIESLEVKADKFSGTETILWGTQDASTGKGYLTQGNESVAYTGAGSNNTVYDHLGLSFSTSDTANIQKIELQGSVNMGAGAMTFDNGKWEISEKSSDFTFNSAGFVVNGDAELTLKLTGTSSEEWRKVGSGIMTIAGKGNNDVVLRVGGGTTVYNVVRDEDGNIVGCTLGNEGETRLNREGGYAASSVRLEAGVAIIVLMGNEKDASGQFKTKEVAGDTFTFGNAGGLLNLNGHDLTWGVINQDGSGTGARIGNFTPKGESTPGLSTLTYTGTGTFAGCFMDEGKDSTAKLAVKYNNAGGAWTLTGNNTNVGGYTVEAGTMILEGSNTPHVGMVDEHDWAYASMEGSNVTVNNGAKFQLSHHAVMSGDISVDAGGTFEINQTVNAASESISGSGRQDMAALGITSLKGNVYLDGGASMVVNTESPVVTTMKGNVVNNLGNDATNPQFASFTKSGSGIFVIDGQLQVPRGTIEAGGLVVKDKENFVSSYTRWAIQEKGFLAIEGLDNETALACVALGSNGVLALTSDQATALNMSLHENLIIGAWGDKAINYGTSTATLGTVYDAESERSVWRLGGGTGTLNVNFQLTGDADLLVGNEWSSGTVHLTNEKNDFSGDIYIQGFGNKLTYEQGALGNAKVKVSYGNALALYDASQLGIIKDASAGVLALSTNENIDLSASQLAVGANGDFSYTGKLTVDAAQGYRFGGSGNLTLNTELNGSDKMKIDGQGTYGSSVTFAHESGYQGSIVAGAGLELDSPNSRGDIGIHVEYSAALASATYVDLQQGATLYTDGKDIEVGNLNLQSGSLLCNNAGTVSKVTVNVSENKAVEFADGVLDDSRNAGQLQLVKTGAGKLTIANNDSWAGTLLIDEGTVVATTYSTDSRNHLGGIGSHDSTIWINDNGTLEVIMPKQGGVTLGGTAVPQKVLGTGTVKLASGGVVVFSTQTEAFAGTVSLDNNTRLYIGKLNYDGTNSIDNRSALSEATVEVASGSQVRVTNALLYGQTSPISTTASFVISGNGFEGEDHGICRWVMEKPFYGKLSFLNEGALAIDNYSVVYGNITLADDAVISSTSSSFFTNPANWTVTRADNGYGIKEQLGGFIRGQILGEGNTLYFKGNEGMTITADSKNTYGDLVIASGNGNNTDKFALRLDGGKAVSQTSTALGKGNVTLGDGLILRLAGTGTANQTDVVYTYDNNIAAGNNSTIQSYNITNKLTGTVSMAEGTDKTLNLATANGGVLHLAGGISGAGTVNIAESSKVTLGGNQAFSGLITAGNGADLTLTSSSALAGTATIIGTDSLTLNLEGTSDYTMSQISVTGENSALTLHFDFTDVPTAADNATWNTLNSSVSAATTTIALELNMFNDISKGNYTLITSAGTGAYQLADTMNGRLNLVKDATGALVLVVDADNRLYWSTDGTSNVWNTSDANWYSDMAAGKTTFTANANVMLDASGVVENNSANARETIQLADSLELGSMSVQQAAYEISGNGAITGTTLTVGNKGDLKLSNTGNKTFTGGVLVNDGKLEISGGNLTAEVKAENGGSFSYAGGTLTGNLSVADASADIRNATLAGNISAAGNGTLALQSVKISGNRDFEFSTGKIASTNNVTMTGTFTYADEMEALQVNGMSISGGGVASTSALNVNTLSMNAASITLTHNGGSTTDFGTITGNGSLYKDSAGNLNLKNAALYEFTLKGNGTTTISGTVTASQYFRIGKETVTLLNGANVTAPQLRLGDMGSGQPSTVSIEQGATLTISGSTDADSTGNSLLLAHWGSSSSTLKLNGGTLNALNTQMLMGWDSGGRFEAVSGTANLKGIRFSSQRGNADSFLLGTATTGDARVNLGSGGIHGIGNNDTVNLGNGTIGALADFAINGHKAINLIGTSTGTTFDTAGHTITVNTALAGSGNLIKTGEGTLLLAGAGTDFSGNITVNGGSLAINDAGKSMLESASSVLINSGTLDISHLNFSDSANSIQIGLGQTFILSENASINFGNITANTEYQIFNFSGGMVEGWSNLTAEDIIIGGVKLSEMGRTQYTLGVDGYFSYNILGDRELIWNGGSASTSWTQTETIQTWTNESREDTAFANFDSVVFNSDAVLTLEGDIHVKNLTLSEGVSLKTTGQLTVHGAMTLANGFNWDFSGNTTLSFSEATLKTAGKIVVGEDATLVMTNKTTGQNNTSTAFNNVSGTGDIVLNLAADNGVGFNLSGFAGDITVDTGRLQVNTSSFNEASTIYLATTDSELVFNATSELKNDVVLGADTTFHVNKPSNTHYQGTISGDLLGEDRKLKKAGGSTLILKGRTALKTLETYAGQVIIDSSSAYIETVDASMNNSAGGSLKLAQNAILNVSGDVMTRSSTGIYLESGAVLALLGHNVAVINTGTGTASVKATTGNGQTYSLDQANYEIQNARVVYTGSESATLSNKLTNVTLENSISNAVAPADLGDETGDAFYAGSTLTVTNADNTLNGVVAYGGDITLQNLQAATSLNLLEIAAGRTVSATTANGGKSNITVTDHVLLGGGATLHSSLTLADGATLEMDNIQSGIAIVTGALSFEGQLTMGDKLLTILDEMSSWENHELTLITGLDSFTFDGVEVEDGSMLQANTYFSNVSDTLSVSYRVSGDVGSLVLVSMDVVPEPTTSTLSLLALAGLCARRRRKD